MTTPNPQKRAKFVFVPAHITEPLEEWEVEYTEDQAVECLLDKVKAHFAKLKGPKTPEQLAAQREAFLQHLPAEQRASVPASLLETATGLGMVENVALLSNSAEHDFVGVNLYCDDEAGVLGAATNVRASEIAHRAGKQLDVKGDAFLARVRDDGNDIFERIDMGLRDVSSSAAWVRQAEAQNRKKAEGESAASAMKRLGVSGIGAANGASGGGGGGGGGGAGSVLRASPKPKNTIAQISELSASAAAREEGNAAFRKGQWKEAEKNYSRAIELATAAKKGQGDGAGEGEGEEGSRDMDADDAGASEDAAAADDDVVAAANNRAAARLKLGDSAGALQDAESVVRLRPSDVKARLRRAAALEALGDGKRASEDYKFVLRLEPRNTQALQGMDKIKGKKAAL